MKKITLKYDTMAIGRCGEKVSVPIAIADLLEEMFFYFDVIRNTYHPKSKRKEIESYVFVPILINECLDFRVFRKDTAYDCLPIVQDGIAAIKTIL